MLSELQAEESHTEIGNYLLGKTVGEGTFGKVKTAVHQPTGQIVAVKVIVKSKIADVNDAERVARELHILRIVRHPSIVQLYQIIETPRHLFIITEFAQQGELYQHIVNKGHLSEEGACLFFHQLIAGLKYMKELRISHRDLKPQNILLDHNQNIKIIDFGLSNTYQDGDTLKTACGSPCYAAPEMLGGKSYEGTAVDIWSCGIILFAMVCGYLPFEDANTNKLYKKIMQGSIPFPSTVSPKFVDFISRILEVDPSKRAKIQDIEDHSWFKLSKSDHPTKGVKVGTHLIQGDPTILKEMQKLGFDITHAKISIQANKQGPDYAAYYLQMKKMKREGYESQYDINSTLFQYVSPDENAKESFENTRKSYYFGVHDMSSLKKSRREGKSNKKGSPSKSQLSVQRKKKIKISQESLYFTSSKLPKATNKKWKKPNLQLKSGNRFKKKMQIKSLQLGDSPIRPAFYNTMDRKSRGFSSNKKVDRMSREKKNKSWSQISRYS